MCRSSQKWPHGLKGQRRMWAECKHGDSAEHGCFSKQAASRRRSLIGSQVSSIADWSTLRFSTWWSRDVRTSLGQIVRADIRCFLIAISDRFPVKRSTYMMWFDYPLHIYCNRWYKLFIPRWLAWSLLCNSGQDSYRLTGLVPLSLQCWDGNVCHYMTLKSLETIRTHFFFLGHVFTYICQCNFFKIKITVVLISEVTLPTAWNAKTLRRTCLGQWDASAGKRCVLCNSWYLSLILGTDIKLEGDNRFYRVIP